MPPLLFQLLILVPVFVVMMFAFRRLGLSRWPAYWVTFGLVTGVAALVQFVVWPGRW